MTTASKCFINCWISRELAWVCLNPLYKPRYKRDSSPNLTRHTNTQTHAVTDLREIIKIVADNVWQFLSLIKSLRDCFFPTPQNSGGRNYQSLSALFFSLSFLLSALPAPVSPVGTTIQEWKIACSSAHIHICMAVQTQSTIGTTASVWKVTSLALAVGENLKISQLKSQCKHAWRCSYSSDPAGSKENQHCWWESPQTSL